MHTQPAHHPHSKRASDILRHYLGDIVYGASDGIITTFAIVSSVVGANLSAQVIIILGFANLVADGFSMGASNFLAIRSDAEASNTPRGIWEPFVHALYTFFAFILVGGIPLFAFLIPAISAYDFEASCLMTTISLFFLGAFRSYLGNKKWLLTGIEMALVGLVAAVVAFLIGLFLKQYMP